MLIPVSDAARNNFHYSCVVFSLFTINKESVAFKGGGFFINGQIQKIYNNLNFIFPELRKALFKPWVNRGIGHTFLRIFHGTIIAYCTKLTSYCVRH